MKDNFQWTDETVLEFVHYTLHDSPTMQGRYSDLEQFKQSKSKPILFTTEDGKDIYEGDEYWIVYFKDFGISRRIAKVDYIYVNKTFSTEAAAKEYVLMNQNLFSVIDICKLYDANENHISYGELYDRITELAEQKINQTK